jgi:hypothetical protein
MPPLRPLAAPPAPPSAAWLGRSVQRHMLRIFRPPLLTPQPGSHMLRIFRPPLLTPQVIASATEHIKANGGRGAGCAGAVPERNQVPVACDADNAAGSR